MLRAPRLIKLIRPVGLAAVCAAASALSAVTLADIDGEPHKLPAAPSATATVVFYVTHDCPISNRYMPEIRRICAEYGARGARCLLAYVDPTISVNEIKEHRQEYGVDLPAVQDVTREVVQLGGATVTPEAAVFAPSGGLVYRGRIDNLYAALGVPRRTPTERDLRDALDALLSGRPVPQPRTQAVGCFISSFGTNGKEISK